MTGRDPAVDIWADAIREVIGRDPSPISPDRRTPAQVAYDDHLEHLAETRADERAGRWASPQEADEAADRYYRDRCC